MRGRRPPTRVDILFGLAYHPDQRVKRLSGALADAGYAVRILAWDRDGALPRREDADGVAVERIRVHSRSGRGWTQALFLARAVPGWLRALRRDPPHVIHAVDLPMLTVALLLRPFVGSAPKLVFDAFEIYSLMEAHKYPRLLLRLLAWMERRLPRLADLVITPGYERQAFFARRGVQSIVVGNWVDPPARRPDRAASRDRLGIARDAFCLVYAGGLEPSRDLEPLIEYARHAERDVVIVAGRGEQAPTCADAARSMRNFRFLGWLPDPSGLYASADAIFYALTPDHPYAAHAAPNNLYFAIAYAVPLVYREQGELAAIARESPIGVPFDEGRDVRSAVDALREPAVHASIQASLSGLQARYSWQGARRTLLEAYSALTGMP